MTQFTVLTWNMAMGYGPGCSWDRLEDLVGRYGVDVALLSEVKTGVLRNASGALYEAWGTRGRDRKPRAWSTAIVSRHPLVEIRDARAMSYDGRRPNVRFENSRPGSWTAGVIDMPGAVRITCLSIYGLMDELSDSSVHRALSDMSALFSDPRYKRHLVMGGDLNITTQYPRGRRLDACMAVLARIRAYGLTDLLADKWEALEEECGCTFGDDCRHTRTRIDPDDPGRPLQVDYVFASEDMTFKPYVCSTLPREDWAECSDHAPILAIFDLPSAAGASMSGSDTESGKAPWHIEVRGHPARRDSVTWREAIRDAALRAYPKDSFVQPAPGTKFAVDVVFRLTSEDMARPAFDLDNFAKPILDTLFTSQNVSRLSRVLFPDTNDTWVFRLHLEKMRVPLPEDQGAYITITPYPPGSGDLTGG